MIHRVVAFFVYASLFVYARGLNPVAIPSDAPQ